MILSQALTDMGFSLSDVEPSDFDAYYAIHRVCYEKYVDAFYGGWVDDVQLKMNTDAFAAHSGQTTFKKILLHNEVVGFLALDEGGDKIDGISVEMIEKAQNKGMGSFFLHHVVSLAQKGPKPVFLQVFKSNPAQNLYRRFGFETYDETHSHYLMRYEPGT